jgi:hypothetical protein
MWPLLRLNAASVETRKVVDESNAQDDSAAKMADAEDKAVALALW